MTTASPLVLWCACPDRAGIVHAVTGLISELGGFLVDSHHFSDELQARFFMRNRIRFEGAPELAASFEARFAELAQRFEMTWRISRPRKKRMVLLISKQEHCLYDLLGRWSSGELDVEIPLVISNHETHRKLVEFHGLPFRHLPMAADNKQVWHDQLMAWFDEADADVYVLARFMQIIPPDVCAKYAGRIVNIHHSFLPSFVGAKPYHQAYERGVKMIGATCHYVTSDLDEGPIITQETIGIDHTHTPDTLVRFGKDIEKTVLAKGLRAHLDDRIWVDGRRTIVFAD